MSTHSDGDEFSKVTVHALGLHARSLRCRTRGVARRWCSSRRRRACPSRSRWCCRPARWRPASRSPCLKNCDQPMEVAEGFDRSEGTDRNTIRSTITATRTNFQLRSPVGGVGLDPDLAQVLGPGPGVLVPACRDPRHPGSELGRVVVRPERAHCSMVRARCAGPGTRSRRRAHGLRVEHRYLGAMCAADGLVQGARPASRHRRPVPDVPSAGDPSDPADPLSRRSPVRDSDAQAPGVVRDGRSAGSSAGYLASALLLTVFAAASGNLKDLSHLEGLSVPPWWVTIAGLVGLWIGFLGAVFLASRSRGTGKPAADMGSAHHRVGTPRSGS